MRIKVHLKTNQLPVSYRMFFVAMVKEAINRGDGQLYQQLFIENISQPKKYTFAIYLINFKKKDTIFEVDGATMTISSSDPYISIALINGFQQIATFEHNGWKATLTKLELVKEKMIHSSIVKFETLSPILLEDQNKKPLLITDATFEQEMNVVTNKQFLSTYGRPLKRPLKIVDYAMKKQVVQETNRHANGQTLFFTTQKGWIILEGDVEDLTFIYQDGWLLRSAQGLGSMEVIEQYGYN